MIFREDFRKSFKEANPDCKSVATVMLKCELFLNDSDCLIFVI